MRPITTGSDTPHGFDEWLARDTQRALERFTTFRWNDVNGLLDSDRDGTDDDLALWSTRRPFGVSYVRLDDPSHNHELKILFNNAIGRDLYIQIPANADDAYIRNLARLIRYGGDASGQPYTAAVADPHFPPLNPNLRVFVEYANETPWNTAVSMLTVTGSAGGRRSCARPATRAGTSSTTMASITARATSPVSRAVSASSPCVRSR